MAMPKSRWIHEVYCSSDDRIIVKCSDSATTVDWHQSLVTLDELTTKELQRCYRNIGKVSERHWDRAALENGIKAHFGLAVTPSVSVPKVPTPSVSVSATAPTTSLDLGIISQVISATVAEAMANYAPPTPSLDEARVAEIVAEGIAKATLPQTVTVISPKVPQGSTVQGAHKDFTKVVKLVGAGLYPWLHGEAGTGKTTLAMQIADALGLPFYGKSMTLQTTESSFFGYQTADGTLVRKAFREAWEHGGVFLLDEASSVHPNLAATINMAAANGICEFPDGMIRQHSDFRLIAAANDIGQGPSSKYPKGVKQDTSFLDRFTFKEITLDESIVDAGVRSRLQGYQADRWLTIWSVARSNARGGAVTVTPRSAFQGAEMIALGFTEREAAESAILRGADGDLATRILQDCGI